jgi:hypothetical protein
MKKTNGSVKLPRITCLDPAFPLFYPGLIAGHLSASDAEMVDVIHTSAWSYGAPVSTGSVDFWPNDGTSLQPGCPKRNYIPLDEVDLCSHWRSWRFWADSVANQKNYFYALKCDTWSNFKRGKCIKNEVILMGIECPKDARGNFYLQTNDEVPFSRGKEGIVYQKKQSTKM